MMSAGKIQNSELNEGLRNLNFHTTIEPHSPNKKKC